MRFQHKATVLATVMVLAAPAAAQSAAKGFAPPVRLKSGAKWLGESRLYPSPVLHDVNGDGQLDIVVGDLFGRITYALRTPGPVMEFEAEKDLLDARGNGLKFHNW